MHLFHGVQATSGLTGLEAVVRATEGSLSGLPKPCSIAELRADMDDVTWLHEWMDTLDPAQVRDWLERRPYRTLYAGEESTVSESFGLALFLLAAEVVRRESPEGEAWPAVRRHLPAAIEAVTFVQGQPKRGCRDALEAAARRFGLRHVFDLTGTQNWYVSVHLQFGFCRAGVSRLPWWLAGGPPPESVRVLLEEQSQNSFKTLWRCLRRYRDGNLNAEGLASFLSTSPWVLPEWADELLKCARERIQQKPGQQEDDVLIPFLAPPRIEWVSPSPPRIRLNIVNLAVLDLDSPHYDLLVHNRCAARVHMQPDGSYEIDAEDILVDLGGSDVGVSLVASDGAVRCATVLKIWDPNEDVNVFDGNSGLALDAWNGRLSPSGRYLFLAASDLEVIPQPSLWHTVGDGSFRLYLIDAGNIGATRVLLDGKVLWEPLVADRPHGEAVWARNVQVRCAATKDVPFGSPVRLQIIGLPADTSLAYIRTGGHSIGFQEADGVILTEPVNDHTAVVDRTFDVTVSLLKTPNETFRLRRTVLVPWFGVLKLGPTGWEPLSADKSLTTIAANRLIFRVCPPLSRDDGPSRREWALVEGATWITSFNPIARLRACPLGRLEGLGAPLMLRQGVYNSVGKPIRVASAVLDHGVVRKVDLCVADGTLSVGLGEPVQPGPGHAIILWTPGNAPNSIGWEAVTPSDGDGWRSWNVRLGDMDAAPLTVSVAFNGERLGTWFDNDRRLLSALSGEARANETAAMLRWLRFPVLFAGLRKTMAQFVNKAPDVLLSAWLSPCFLPAGLAYPPSDEDAWLNAVRALFCNWVPADPAAARAAISSLAAAANPVGAVEGMAALCRSDRCLASLLEPMHKALSLAMDIETSAGLLVALFRVDPLVVARLLLHWLSTLDPQRRRAIAMPARELHRRLSWQGSGYHTTSASLSATAANDMGLDEYFLTNLASRALAFLDDHEIQDVDRENLMVAIRATAFRRFLGNQVLQRLLRWCEDQA